MLFSQDLDMPIAWFDKFNKEEIKQTIIFHLTVNPRDTVEHCKDFDNADIRKYYGSKIINLYQCNKDGKPSLVFTRGAKQYYKPLK